MNTAWVARRDLSIEIADADGRLTPATLRWLHDHAGKAAAELGVIGEARVKIVGDGPMAIAHHRYAGVAGTTDVLTFDLSEPGASAERGLDADLLVCVDEAERQSVARGHAVERELLLYIVHGLLHCLGHDDHDDDAAAAMHAREDRVLSAIGVGPVYGAGDGGSAP